MIKQTLNEIENTWITAFDGEFRRVMGRREAGEDISGDRTLHVLENIRQVMARYPDPIKAVRAMNYTAKVDFWREDARQRGEGVRHGRTVLRFTASFDLIDHRATNPETQAIQRDECRTFLSVMKPVVAKGFLLTAIGGLDQAAAAKQIGVTRTGLCKQMNQSRNAVLESEAIAA